MEVPDELIKALKVARTEGAKYQNKAAAYHLLVRAVVPVTRLLHDD